MVASPRNRTKPSYDVPDNVVVLDDDDEDDVLAPEPTRLVLPEPKPPATGGNFSGAGMNQQLYLWHQVAAHMRRERMLAEQIRAAAGVAPSSLMTSPQYFSDNNNNVDPMIQFQAEVLQKQYLLYAHFYHNNLSNFIDNSSNNNINNINRIGIRPVLGVNPTSRVIRKLSAGGAATAAAARLQYGYVHGGAMTRPEQPIGPAPTRARVTTNSGQTGLGLELGVGGGEIEPEGIDLTLKL